MPNYNIAGIKINFNFLYDDFFKDNIGAYLTDETAMDYQMHVHQVGAINPIKGIPNITFKNRSIFHKDGKVHIMILDQEGLVKQLIVHTLDYKTVDIYLSRTLNKQLAELEYVITGLIFLELAILEKRLALHGAALVHDNKAIIFSASSGTGKSTHANYWCDTFENIMIINDDKPVIYKENNTFYVAGTPWCGKDVININASYPLKSIVFLNQGKLDIVKEISTKEKLQTFLKNCIRPRNEALMQDTLTMIEDLVLNVSMVAYDATHSIGSVKPIYNYLFGGQYENKK
ncbi:hypothetical protein [Liberiplasma polymorphum]|uniref:hypothetical protein n=1 Tax=Liberiplasma polymorphum TaxID=3374570 RepID=UPI0037768B0E